MMADASAPVTRHAVRVLLLDEADRLLLVRFWDQDRSWWCTPGGGIEPGESDLAAAARELREELGEAPIEIGPLHLDPAPRRRLPPPAVRPERAHLPGTRAGLRTPAVGCGTV